MSFRHAAVFIFSVLFASAFPAIGQQPAHCVMDATTAHVLLASRADAKVQVGSLTKVATAIVVLDWAKRSGAELNQITMVTPEAAAVEGMNPVGFQPGDRVTLRDLLFAALLQSDNVAASALADHVGRSLGGGGGSPSVGFVAQMNALARTLGMHNTLFLNPHGLEAGERKPPYSTAYDMALLARHAMSRPEFTFLVSQKERRITIQRAGGGETAYMLQNTNELLGRENIDGVKTGKTRRAGECVIVSAARPPESRQEGATVYITPRRLIVVVLGAAQRFPMAAQLLQQGWAEYDGWAAQGRPVRRRG
jgi:D-alanyl-D-alanine carboxypeptidase (penicillin-binding protein 5/6)